MFVHHVFFWLRPDADRAELIAGLRQLATVEHIQQHQIGVPADTHRPVVERSYGVSWLLIFEAAEAEAAYQTHPKHLQFIAECQHLWERVVVYDSVDSE
jgi:hypothetical protein